MIAAFLNLLSEKDAKAALLRCCGSTRWVEKMCLSRPFDADEHLFADADRIWNELERSDILEAFSHHPQIGASKELLRKKFQTTETWSASEQAGVSQADDEILERLVLGNQNYLNRFGYIFIVCATGKTAKEMCMLLEARLHNPLDDELSIAAAEQAKITHIRLEKLIS